MQHFKDTIISPQTLDIKINKRKGVFNGQKEMHDELNGNQSFDDFMAEMIELRNQQMLPVGSWGF